MRICKHIKYVELLTIGSVISASVFTLLVYLLRLKPLKDNHAARGSPVSVDIEGHMEITDSLGKRRIDHSTAHYKVFRFCNCHYAYAFAKANKCSVNTKAISRYSKKTVFDPG